MSVCVQDLNPCAVCRAASLDWQPLICTAALMNQHHQLSPSWHSEIKPSSTLLILYLHQPLTAHNNPSEQQVGISMFAFPVLAVHWRLMKISQSISCDLKRSTLIREALKSRQSHTTLVTLKSEAWWLLSLLPPRWRGNSLGVSKVRFCLIMLSDHFKALFAHKHCTN